MRLKYSVTEQIFSNIEFWRNACSYDGKSVCSKGRCCNPETAEYQKRCREIWHAWREAGFKGKYPIMPPPIVECEKCKYADLTVGAYEGIASLRTINRHVEGTIPVPVKGRKKIWIDNVNQKQLERVLDDVDCDIEAFAITGSPTIQDFTFLERFPKLKRVYLWWNNKATSLWDITKTPDIQYLYLRDINKLTDISQVSNAKKLRSLYMYIGSENIATLRPLENHPSLEFLFMYRIIDDADMRPLITIPNLKYLNCQTNLFDIEEYARFEAKRPDVDTNFWEGIEGYEDSPNQYFTQLVGSRQRSVRPDDYAKQKKHKNKYLAIKQKYMTVD